MIYTSETIERVVTSPAALRTLGDITPQYAEAENFLELLQMGGPETDEMVRWGEEFLLEVNPATATWTLPYWEEEYGLPDGSGMEIGARRERLVDKIRFRGAFNPARITKMIFDLTGYTVKITENIAPNTFLVAFTVTPLDGREVFAIIDRHKPAHVIYKIGTFSNSGNTPIYLANWPPRRYTKVRRGTTFTMSNFVTADGQSFVTADGLNFMVR